ncbi:MAG: tRNA pseudouridine(55) synthase TruB [Deltaproteobacteria bacterium]|nr:tRNA pseudouridine(55) synthase TruB [Deltaproteobacteria bacterium]
MHSGFLLIDKPAGISSNQALTILKRKTGLKKMGHTGTLDPFATGLLIVGIGQATKQIPFVQDEPKVYEAELKLGEETDTLDPTGKMIRSEAVPPLTDEQIRAVAASIIGPQEQIPPMFSAKQIDGQRLYELARAGKTVERKPVKINIYDIKVKEIISPFVRFEVTVSGGTYVRVLALTLAQKLGTVGHLTQLRRVKMGEYEVKNAVLPESVSTEDIFFFSSKTPSRLSQGG